MTEDDVREIVRAQKSKELAGRAGVSVTFINYVKRGVRPPSAAIIAALGIRKVVTVSYEKEACNSQSCPL